MKEILLAVFLVVSIVACSKKEAAKNGPYLAKVDGTPITQADFDREIRSLPDYARQMFEGPGGKEKFLGEVINKEVLYQEALKQGMDKSPEFIRKMEDARKMALISDLLEKEIMSTVKVTDKDVRDYYDRHRNDFTTMNQIRASHILVKTRAEAEKVLERLKKGEKFAEIARKESIDRASAKNGGDIGYFSRGQIVPEFEKAAASLDVGQISGPVKTRFGYHIIKVTDKKTGPVAEFERVKEIIREKLTGQKQKEAFDSYLDGLMKKYKVEVNKEAFAASKDSVKGTAPKKSHAE
ncbi:MAG: peptidylprolyl isomerase [Candidatus Sulfobium sp.]|jgi:peptidyl-prolyl cis-trans isomerase C